MLLKYVRVGTWEVVDLSGLEVVGYRYGPWK
jgi:hypothetical protein